ncbi:hypothetical protein ElyMa_000786900, partial [Elysia marginata]
RMSHARVHSGAAAHGVYRATGVSGARWMLGLTVALLGLGLAGHVLASPCE